MPKKKHKPEEIVAKLRQADVLISQGQDIADVIRQIGVSEVAYAMNCSMVKSSTRCGRPKSLSKAGGATSTRSGRMNRSDTNHQHLRCSCQPLQRGRLRYVDRLRRPRWRNGQLSTNIPLGPLDGGRSVMASGCTVVSTVTRARSLSRSAPLSCVTLKLSASSNSSLSPSRLRCVAVCASCGDKTYDAAQINRPCFAKPGSRLKMDDWAKCDLCNGVGKSNEETCKACQDTGWIFQHTGRYNVDGTGKI